MTGLLIFSRVNSDVWSGRCSIDGALRAELDRLLDSSAELLFRDDAEPLLLRPVLLRSIATCNDETGIY